MAVGKRDHGLVVAFWRAWRPCTSHDRPRARRAQSQMARVVLRPRPGELMTTDKSSLPTESTKQTRPQKIVENSTDATRGEPLAMRARKRKLELERALAKLPADDRRARNDIAAAMASIDGLLTGDVEHLSDTTAADLSRLLENIKHLAEVNPVSKSRERK